MFLTFVVSINKVSFFGKFSWPCNSRASHSSFCCILCIKRVDQWGRKNQIQSPLQYNNKLTGGETSGKSLKCLTRPTWRLSHHRVFSRRSDPGSVSGWPCLAPQTAPTSEIFVNFSPSLCLSTFCFRNPLSEKSYNFPLPCPARASQKTWGWDLVWRLSRKVHNTFVHL